MYGVIFLTDGIFKFPINLRLRFVVTVNRDPAFMGPGIINGRRKGEKKFTARYTLQRLAGIIKIYKTPSVREPFTPTAAVTYDDAFNYG